MKKTISREELDKYIEYIDMALKSDLDDINNFNYSDLVRLERNMCINLYNLKKYDAKVVKLANKLALMYDKRDNLTWQTRATGRDIVNNSAVHMKWQMVSVVMLSLLWSQDGYDFIKKLVILLGIYFFTFETNLAYFTSDRHRDVATKKLSILEESISKEEIYYQLYQQISKSFSLKLDAQYDKLLELYPEINEEVVKIKRRKMK